MIHWEKRSDTMSELNIKIRKLQDNGSTFRATPESLYMGGVGSAKVDTLCFDVPEEWKGCAITLHVQRLSGTLPDPQLLDEKNRAVVDQRWTKEKQGLWMLMAVGADGYTAMTKPGRYTCYETIDRDSTTEDITPSVYEQFVALVQKETAKANQAAKNAAASAEIAKSVESTITATGEQVQREITATADQTKKDLTATADQTKQAIDEKAKAALASIPEDYTALNESVGQVKEDINVLGLEESVKTSLKCDYLENAPTMNINADYVYTLGDKARIFRNVKKLKLSILSNGGTGTIFLYRPDSIYTQILVFKKSYVLTAEKNEIEIDISESMFDSSPSEGHDYISIAIYSNDIGAFTSQNGQLYLYSNGDPFAWYGNFSDFNVEINNFIPPQTYWGNNISTNKTYPCIDVYMEEKIPKYKSGIIHVSKDGTGDYSTIMDAVRNAGDVDSPTTIILQEGVYDEIVYLGNKHNISIVGVNRDQCIIKNTSGIYANTPVMVTGNFELRNLTIRMEEQGFFPEYTDNVWATYPGYALHIDGNSKNINEKTTGRVTNCTLYSEAFPSVGMGVNQNQKIIFENCEMIRNCSKDYFKKDNWKGAFLCHSSNYNSAENQFLILRNCVIISNYGYSGNIRGNLGDSSNFTVEAINNTCYSEEMGLDAFEYDRGESKLSKISHGNTASSLNAVN